MVMTYRVGRQKNSDYSTHTQKAASQLEHAINDWASKVLRIAPAPAATLQEAVLTDITDVGERSALFWDVLPITVQCLLRHALTWVISEGIFNSLIVTNSAEENAVLTRVHERLLTRTFIPLLSSAGNVALTPLLNSTMISRLCLLLSPGFFGGFCFQGMWPPLQSGVVTLSPLRWSFSAPNCCGRSSSTTCRCSRRSSPTAWRILSGRVQCSRTRSNSLACCAVQMLTRTRSTARSFPSSGAR